MINPEDIVGEEWAEWYRLTPAERWRESEKLWQTYLQLGGSLDPEPDTQSPFFDEAEWKEFGDKNPKRLRLNFKERRWELATESACE
jgi:hypothetical protein